MTALTIEPTVDEKLLTFLIDKILNDRLLVRLGSRPRSFNAEQVVASEIKLVFTPWIVCWCKIGEFISKALV